MSDNGRDYWDASLALTASAQKLYDQAHILSPYESHRLDLTIFVSCYNEQDSIIATLDTIIDAMRVLDCSYEILVIDDASKDHSVEFVRAYIAEHPEVNILLRANKKNKGLAHNYFDGAFIGCGKYYRLMHGNNTEPMETIVDIFKSLGEADIIIPYYIPSLGEGGQPQMLSQVYTRLLNLLGGHRINYYNGRHVHLRYNVMRWHPNTHGFGFQADLLCQLLDLGFTFKQVPCRVTDESRRRGKSLSLRNVLSVLHTMLDIVLRRLSSRLYG